MKRIVIAALAAMLLGGCSLKMPETGKGNNTAKTNENVFEAKVGGETVPKGNNAIYDKGGVKVTFDTDASIPVLTVSNSSSKTLTLGSAYASADGVVRDISLEADSVAPGSISEIPLDDIKNVGTLRTRFYLSDEDFHFIEDSLSEPVEITVSGTAYLPSKQLYTIVHDDDNVKLGLCKVTYREDTNRVRLTLYAENKTDTDVFLTAAETECDHKDYYSYFSTALPAKASSVFTITASTRNNTLSPGDLNSITFSLKGNQLGAYFGSTGNGSETPVFETGKITLKLPKKGRPERIVPDSIVQRMTPEEYKAEVFEDEDLTELPLYGDKPEVCEDANVLSEFLFAALGTESSGVQYVSLHFRVQNKLNKQITFSPIGTLNGATADFSCYNSIGPMTEDYIEVTCSLLPEEVGGPFSDALVWFDYNYDDGSIDNSSYIGSTGGARIICAEELSRPGVPKGVKQIYSDDNCELYLLETNTEGERPYIAVYALNKSDKLIEVSMRSDEVYIWGTLQMFKGTYTARAMSVYRIDGEKVTEKDIRNLKINAEVSDADGVLISKGEGSL